MGKLIDSKAWPEMARPLICLFCVATAFQSLGKVVQQPRSYLPLFEKNQTSTVIADIQATISDFNIDTF